MEERPWFRAPTIPSSGEKARKVRASLPVRMKPYEPEVVTAFKSQTICAVHQRHTRCKNPPPLPPLSPSFQGVEPQHGELRCRSRRAQWHRRRFVHHVITLARLSCRAWFRLPEERGGANRKRVGGRHREGVGARGPEGGRGLGMPRCFARTQVCACLSVRWLRRY